MPELFVILIKVNIALVLFCLGYYLVLRKLTFYTLNRAYLITAIIFSSVYPFIDLSVFAQRHQEIITPVQNVVIIWQAPAENFIKQAAYWNWLEIIFWTGAALFAARLLFQLASLYKIYSRSTKRNINGQNVRVVTGDISPFSFWQSIYINPEKLSATDLKNIIEHEQVHVKEWHTLDVLLTEISVIFYWFNPGIWMMKRAVRENIEFITDRKILQKGLDSKAYQYSLLNITFNQQAPAITSNFNFSTLKKRITMMNAKRSSKINLTRYALLLPVVVVSLCAFSLSKAEVVKSNPVYKTLATATAKTLDKLGATITLPTDTTPKKITRTITITTEALDKPNRSINITTIDGAKINGDTTREKRIRIATTGTYRLSTANADSITSITIDGKKATKEELRKVLPNIDNAISVMAGHKLNEIVVNGSPFTTSTPGVFKGDLKNVIVNDWQITPGKLMNSDLQKSFIYKDSAGVRLAQGFNVTFDVKTDTGKMRIKPNISYATRYIMTDDKAQPLTYTISSVFGSNTTDFSNKLIVIDGNEATEKALKKISIGDISNIKELKGRAAIDKYGEKGKNGVVVITTKKEKKK